MVIGMKRHKTFLKSLSAMALSTVLAISSLPAHVYAAEAEDGLPENRGGVRRKP